MTKLKELTVRGFRSFDYDEGATIKFTAPVTVIHGSNGTGKTTLVESLRFVTNNRPPKFCKSAKGFVRNRELDNKERKLTSCVTLRFESTKGEEMVMLRSNEVKKENGLGGGEWRLGNKHLTIQNNEDSLRANLKEVSSHFGVPSALLEHVLFCPQDDYEWPIKNDQKTSIIYNSIFDNSKDLEELGSLKKSIAIGEKDKVELRREVGRLESQAKEATDFHEKIKTTKDAINKLTETLKGVSETKENAKASKSSWDKLCMDQELKIQEAGIRIGSILQELEQQRQLLPEGYIEQMKQSTVPNLAEVGDNLSSQSEKINKELEAAKAELGRHAQASAFAKNNYDIFSVNYLPKLSNSYTEVCGLLKIQAQNIFSLIEGENIPELEALNEKLVKVKKDMETKESSLKDERDRHYRKKDSLESERNRVESELKHLRQHKQKLHDEETEIKRKLQEKEKKIKGHSEETLTKKIEEERDHVAKLSEEIEDYEEKCRHENKRLEKSMRRDRDQLEQLQNVARNTQLVRERCKKITEDLLKVSAGIDSKRKNGNKFSIGDEEDFSIAQAEALTQAICNELEELKEVVKPENSKNWMKRVRLYPEMNNILEREQKLVEKMITCALVHGAKVAMETFPNFNKSIENQVRQRIVAEIQKAFPNSQENGNHAVEQFDFSSNNEIFKSSKAAYDEIQKLKGQSVDKVHSSTTAKHEDKMAQLRRDESIQALTRLQSVEEENARLGNQIMETKSIWLSWACDTKYTVRYFKEEVDRLKDKLAKNQDEITENQEILGKKKKRSADMLYNINEWRSIRDEIREGSNELFAKQTRVQSKLEEKTKDIETKRTDLKELQERLEVTKSNYSDSEQQYHNEFSEEWKDKIGKCMLEFQMSFATVCKHVSVPSEYANAKSQLEVSNNQVAKLITQSRQCCIDTAYINYLKKEQELEQVRSALQKLGNELTTLNPKRESANKDLEELIKESAKSEGMIKALQETLKTTEQQFFEKGLENAKEQHDTAAKRFDDLKIKLEDDEHKREKLKTRISDQNKTNIDSLNKKIDYVWEYLKSKNANAGISRIAVRSKETPNKKYGLQFTYEVVVEKESSTGRKCSSSLQGACSTGQKYLICLVIRISLANAFNNACTAMVLDEPSSNLDDNSRDSIAEVLKLLFEDKKETLQLIVCTRQESFTNLLRKRFCNAAFYKVTKGKSKGEGSKILNDPIPIQID